MKAERNYKGSIKDSIKKLDGDYKETGEKLERHKKHTRNKLVNPKRNQWSQKKPKEPVLDN